MSAQHLGGWRRSALRRRARKCRRTSMADRSGSPPTESAKAATLATEPGAWRRFRANGPAMFGLGLVVALTLFALIAPWVVGHDPNASDFSLVRDAGGGPPGPSAAHWLGTDPLFRDLLARLAYGA